ncbi:hypothetical protein TJA_23200 [Thermus sp. LT1-2-5]
MEETAATWMAASAWGAMRYTTHPRLNLAPTFLGRRKIGDGVAPHRQIPARRGRALEATPR